MTESERLVDEAKAKELDAFLAYLDETPTQLFPNETCGTLAESLRENLKDRLRLDEHEFDKHCHFCAKEPYYPHNLGDS